MLSYRHAFHAGNYADVLKHLTLVLTTNHMGQKDAPYWYIDTHAGAGRYDLQGAAADKLGEYRDGIGRLWERKDLPPAVEEYVAAIRTFNPNGNLRNYPGSPWLANALLRENDRLRLFELHSTDFSFLNAAFKDAGRRATVTAADGFAGLKALLPPPSRRALVLIDPSYETKQDYQNIPKVVGEALSRFAIGTYTIWYPLLARVESRLLPEKLKSIAGKNWLHATLSVKKSSTTGFGMHGSGMFIINPPWTLAAKLQESLPWLAEVLSQGEGAGFTLEHKE